MIQEIKNRVGQEAEIIIAQGLGLVRVGKKYRCPNGIVHKNGDKNPSMSWDPDALQFYCFTCGKKIDIYEYYREHEGLSHKEILERFNLEQKDNPKVCLPKAKEKPKTVKDKKEIKASVSPLQDNQVRYLLSRGINKETQSYFKLVNIDGNIGIPYYEDNKVVGIKIKNIKKENPKYFSITGSEFGLYNKQNIKNISTLIITEGEFDCNIIYQCGYLNVTSVGTGANSLDKLFVQERDFLNSFGSIILLSDKDGSGQNMDKTFIEEFGYKVKLPNKDLYRDCKDMNEVFLKYGQEQIKKIVNSAAIKIEGLRDLDIRPYEGIEAIEGSYIPTGLPSIDFAINDLSPGLLTLITGRSNGGKSTLVNQIIASAIDKNNKVLLTTGEGIQEMIINNLYRSIIGRDEDCYEYKKINKRYLKEPKKEILKALQMWHKNKFTLFNKGESNLKTTEELFELIRSEVKASKYNLVVIDNLMSILSVEKASEKLEAQADFAQRCCDLAKSEQIHIILVLHPNKQVQKGQTMDFENISGSSDLYNKADNIIAVKRNYDSENLAQGISGEIEVLKNRYFPDLPKVKTHYEKETGMLLEISEETGDYLAYSFKWRQYLNGIQAEMKVPEGFHEVKNIVDFK